MGSSGKLFNWLLLQLSQLKLTGKLGKLVNWLLLQYKYSKDVNPPIPVKSTMFLLETSKMVKFVAGGNRLLEASIQADSTADGYAKLHRDILENNSEST